MAGLDIGLMSWSLTMFALLAAPALLECARVQPLPVILLVLIHLVSMEAPAQAQDANVLRATMGQPVKIFLN